MKSERHGKIRLQKKLVSALEAAQSPILALKREDPIGRLCADSGAHRVNALTLDEGVSVVLARESAFVTRDAGFNVQDPLNTRPPTAHAQSHGSGLPPKPAGRGPTTGAVPGRR